MAYFKEFPNISLVSFLPSATRSDERILVKNIFKRAKLRSDVDKILTAFDFKTIPDGYRPDNVANDLYNDPELDWVILTTNNITNVRDQWPLSNNDLHTYMKDKYGSEENIIATHHFETIEIRDDFNRTILSKGLEVDGDFQITLKTSSNTYQNINAAVPVTNFEFETRVNDLKRIIKVLKPEFVSGYISDFKNIMSYEKSSQFLDRKTKKSYNPKDFGL